jgi:D-alanyl-D-alanine dipeptidase
MVNAAQRSLPPGYRLQLSTALRTLAMQRANWNSYYDEMREKHPDWPVSALRRAVNKFHAPYDQKAPPGHCTGGAVDVLLLNEANELLDLASPLMFWDGAYTWTDRIDPEAKRNRMILVEAMLSAGFSNCRDEYWHYSWGDSAWAVRTGDAECPYGWAHAPIVLETDFDGGAGNELTFETVRDVNGRPVRADVNVAPDTASGKARLAVGLYWANGVPVRVRLAWPSDAEPPRLELSENRIDWTPIPSQRTSDGEFELCLTPSADRVYLAGENARPPVPVETPRRGGPPRSENEWTD